MSNVVDRLKDKVQELGNQKVLLLDQVNKLRIQAEDLNQKLIEEKATMQSLEKKQNEKVSSKNSDNVEGRIDEMVKEIDKCIAILNID